jgi:3-hydroxyisobutyrate dehydrogenase-like beta-hydroxyacid dehydrogenase
MTPMVGVVGLGNMGTPLAANLVAAGLAPIVTDRLGSQRCPSGAVFVDDVAALAARVEVVVLSLPDGAASEAVVREAVAVPDRLVTHVVDTSTVGVAAARAVAAVLGEAGVAHVDAAVSGGPAGARARTLSLMYAGPADACDAVEPVLAALTDRRFHVGSAPGMAQALKLANNFVSATALAATSEAVAFATAMGLEMATVLEVLNASSGRTSASSDKFVHHVLTGAYASGFANTLMAKDVDLYLESVHDAGCPAALGETTAALWREFAAAEPGVDFTRIHPHLAGE